MPTRYKLLKPLPGVPVGTIIDPLCDFNPLGDVIYHRTDITGNPEWFEKVEDAPPYPMEEKERSYYLPTPRFEGRTYATDHPLFRCLTKKHGDEMESALQLVAAALHQKWNDEAAGVDVEDKCHILTADGAHYSIAYSEEDDCAINRTQARLLCNLVNLLVA